MMHSKGVITLFILSFAVASGQIEGFLQLFSGIADSQSGSSGNSDTAAAVIDALKPLTQLISQQVGGQIRELVVNATGDEEASDNFLTPFMALSCYTRCQLEMLVLGSAANPDTADTMQSCSAPAGVISCLDCLSDSVARSVQGNIVAATSICCLAEMEELKDAEELTCKDVEDGVASAQSCLDDKQKQFSGVSEARKPDWTQVEDSLGQLANFLTNNCDTLEALGNQ